MKFSTMTAFKSLNYDGIGVEVEGDLLKKCQRVFLGIAEDVISLLEAEGIWYQLSGGSALGAVREGGFIPWDDDIDLNVLGKDVERIGQLIEQQYGSKYVFHSCHTPHYGSPVARIVLKDSVYRDREGIGVKDCGFFVELFPIENAPDHLALRKIHGTLCLISVGVLSCRKFFQNRAFYRQIAAHNPDISNTIRLKIALGSLVGFLPITLCSEVADFIFGLCKNEESQYVTIPAGRKHYFGEMYLRSGMIDTVAYPFEKHHWQVAKDFDSYFKALYGSDYMIPPPPEEREHHIILELKLPPEASS